MDLDAIHIERNRSWRKFGIEITQESCDRLGAALKRVDEAEQEAWHRIHSTPAIFL